MDRIVNYPEITFVLAFILLSVSVWIGKFIGQRRELEGAALEDFRVVQAATLTLLGLIIGFTFSMALTRYDQRKNYEEAEANAIGTEFVRAELMPPNDASKTKALLREYVEQRVRFYRVGRGTGLEEINKRTEELQAAMWSDVQAYSSDHQTPIAALVVSGMNDVLNSQGYTQASWWNRIPPAAWILMVTIAMSANLMVGFGAGAVKPRHGLLIILPLVISMAFLLIADIDSPRHGLIRVAPQNLLSLSEALAR